MFSNNWFVFGRFTAILSLWLTIAIAATAKANNLHPPESQSDPLLPTPTTNRPLSAFEISRIEREIVRIDRQAKAELAAGNVDEAFNLWYRELKLQRSLGNLQEVAALGRIGNLAWQQNRGFDVRAIAKRLAAIHTAATAENKLSLFLLQELGTAYRQIRYLDRAIDIYQQIAKTKNGNNLAAKRENLEILGELYLDLFDYAEAAQIYEQLLTTASADREIIYLNKLATIYDRNRQLERSITIKKQLAQKYSLTQVFNELAQIYLAIARDYKQLNRPNAAIDYYRQTYSLATDTQQLAVATEVLAELASLYQQQGQIDRAIATYKQQIELQQQAYDYYGWMETCDRLGKIYRDLQNYSQAKFFYQQGLKLALSLNYRVDYFARQLEQIKGL